jgi:biotin carboxyl carrier protein
MKLKITVHGVAYEVDVEILDPGEGFAPTSALPTMTAANGGMGGLGEVTGASNAGPGAADSSGASRVRPVGPPPRPRAGGGDESISLVRSPIAGTVIEVKCKAGDDVEEGDTLLVIEAMKMNTKIASPRAGKIKSIEIAAGDTVREGENLVEFA